MTENPIARPVPITRQDQEFIAQVERWLPDGLVEEVAREFAPAGLPPDQLVSRMGEAAPGDRLRTAVEARMSAGRHFDPLPPTERSAAAEQASLAVAQVIDSSLTVERKEPTSRLGAAAGKVADKVVDAAFRGAHRELAHRAANKAAERLSGAMNWSRFEQMLDVQRHAGAVAPASAPPLDRPATSTNSTPPGRTNDNNRGPIVRG